MPSSTYITVKSVEMDISHVIIKRWGCIFPKVDEWITQLVHRELENRITATLLVRMSRNQLMN